MKTKSRTAAELQRELVEQLNAIKEPASTSDTIATITKWLASNIDEFGSSAETYGLGRFTRLDISSLPIKMMAHNPSEEIDAFRRVARHTVDALAMKIRDAIWTAIVWQTSEQCPNCLNDQLRALKTARTKRIVLACDFCGWAQTLRGERWSGGEDLVIMNTEELAAHGMLDRMHKN
ncbi:hypothetical protein [Sorangium cellulosum]|uniref:hypothetical protein n=1 Tax=Sorangium cellulosum TaxID=56 RepID=UPI0018F8A741|nr:hypothetical protein [Sorangium cellulosum]